MSRTGFRSVLRGVMNRRDFLGGVAVVSLSGCGMKAKTAASLPSTVPPALAPYDVLPRLMPIRAHVDRIFRVTVCLRPFRAAGPRLEVERVGDKTVVHNYGHGGSGWSLSWGSSSIAVEKAMAAGRGIPGLDGAMRGLLAARDAILKAIVAINADIRGCNHFDVGEFRLDHTHQRAILRTTAGDD